MGYVRVCSLYGARTRVARALTDLTSMLATRRIGVCGYTAVPEDGHTCFDFSVIALPV